MRGLARRRYNAAVVSAPQFLHKNIRLPAERYLGRGLYFITLCFHNRRRHGANARTARWLIDELRAHSAACEFLVHAYCVMPDHLHAMATGASETSNLLKFVMSFKQDTAANFARKTHRPLWQFKFYDHILRTADSADRVAWYIWANPVRKGLCADPTDYPFLGSFTEIGTKMLQGSAAADWTPPWKNTAPREAAAPSPTAKRPG